MKTIRLTMAQALARSPRRAAHPHRRRQRTAVPWRVRDFRPRQRGRPRRGARSLPRTPADAARPQRTGHGARGHRLRQGQPPPPADGLHDLGRSRRDKSRDRGGGRAREPAARAAAARRHLREPPTRPGAAADRALRRSDRDRKRLPAAGLALLGSHPAPRTIARFIAAGPLRAARSRGLRPGDARACRRTCRPKPSTIRRRSSTSACTRSSGRARIARGSRPRCGACAPRAGR